jgi:hypothetical protein
MYICDSLAGKVFISLSMVQLMEHRYIILKILKLNTIIWPDDKLDTSSTMVRALLVLLGL